MKPSFFFFIFIAFIKPLLSQERPNILFIVADDLQACLSSYGHETCQTPHLDKLAKQGVLFERAYCQYPVCGPSRASFMSGLYPETIQVTRNSYHPGAFRTHPKLKNHLSLSEFFKNRGYMTARFSKIYHMGVPGELEAGTHKADDPLSWDYTSNLIAPELYSPGPLELLSPSRTHYGSNFAAIQIPNEAAPYQADAMATTQAIAFLENRAKTAMTLPKQITKTKPQGPFFLAIGLVRPHVPLIAPKRCFDLYPPSKMILPEVPKGDLDDVPLSAKEMQNKGRFDMNDAQKQKALSAYYASVTFMDEQVGRLLNALERLKLRQNTIVVFTSDHGYNMGEHDCWQKTSLWEDSTRVPLIISDPRRTDSAGQTTKGITELIDLYPTLLELCDYHAEAPSILQGKSLTPLLQNPNSKKWSDSAYTLTKKGAKSLRTEQWRYNKWSDGEELYHHAQDPKEFKNLAKSPEHQSQLEAMRRQLKSIEASALNQL